MARRMSLFSFCFCLCLFAGALARGSVIYEFAGLANMYGTPQVFRYTAPDFITTDTFVPASALDMCTSNKGGYSFPCFGVSFLPSGPDTIEHYPEILFEILNPDSSVGILYYYLPLGSSFGIPGTLTNYQPYGNPGTLTITQSSIAIPEPATGPIMFLVGMALLLRKG